MASVLRLNASFIQFLFRVNNNVRAKGTATVVAHVAVAPLRKTHDQGELLRIPDKSEHQAL
jgi:hypothetical protein